jgi:hypothetical protein
MMPASLPFASFPSLLFLSALSACLPACLLACLLACLSHPYNMHTPGLYATLSTRRPPSYGSHSRRSRGLRQRRTQLLGHSLGAHQRPGDERAGHRRETLRGSRRFWYVYTSALFSFPCPFFNHQPPPGHPPPIHNPSDSFFVASLS